MNFCVFCALLAALDTGFDELASGAVAIVSTGTVVKLRIRCFDLRTLWYSYQSNK